MLPTGATLEVSTMTTTHLDSLADGGLALWEGVTEAHELDATQRAQLLEACREKDRCDTLHRMLLTADDPKAYLALLGKANETANQMKQLIAALRLPDAQSGKKPQRRGPRGSYKTGQAGKVSSLDRARAAKSG